MHYLENGQRYVPFRLVDDNDVPVTGAVSGDFELYFKRDAQLCADPLALQEWGAGRYALSYTPSLSGTDYIEAYHPAADIRIVDIELIVDGRKTYEKIFGQSFVYELNHDFGGTDRLRARVPNPNTYQLLVFKTSEWKIQNREDTAATGVTTLDKDGRWMDKIPVIAGTYHIVIRKFRENQIIYPNLQVP